MTLRSCRVDRVLDWYTYFQNPNPNYEETLHCTQVSTFMPELLILIEKEAFVNIMEAPTKNYVPVGISMTSHYLSQLSNL